MAGFRSLPWKIGSRALQRSPAGSAKVEHELFLRRLPSVGLFGRPAHPPVARSRLFSSGVSEIRNKNCLNAHPGPAADAKSSLDILKSNGLRQQVERNKEELLHAVPKRPQPSPGDFRLTPGSSNEVLDIRGFLNTCYKRS